MSKTTKLGFLILIAAALAFALGNSALALHDAATLKCMACHTMHGSENGDKAGVSTDNGFDAAGGSYNGPYPSLLVQGSQTDLCLACHSEVGSAADFVDSADQTPPFVMSGGTMAIPLPGGDYYTSNITHQMPTGTYDSFVGGKGHNPYYTSATYSSALIDPDGQLLRDPPGGVYLTLGKWDCVSCHAPHAGDVREATYGHDGGFRLLWTKPGMQVGGMVFDAVGGNLVGDDDGGTGTLTAITAESDGHHTAYQTDVSGWCGSCHTNMHTGTIGPVHPSNHPLPTDMIALYNANPGSMDNYSFITPVEQSTATVGDFAAVDPTRVMCLSCHRAHAASTTASHPDYTGEGGLINNTRNMMRWDAETASGAGRGCNKCHDKGD